MTLAQEDSPFGVSTARDLVRGLFGLGVALLCLLCSGGLERDGPRIIQVLGVAIGIGATWLITRQRAGTPRHNRLRHLVRGLGVVFLVSEMLRFEDPRLEAFDLLFQAPYVVIVGQLIFAHVRPDAPLRARLWVDATLAGTALASLWAAHIITELTHAHATLVGQLIYVVSVLSAVVIGLVLGVRLPKTLRALMPAGVPQVWRSFAAEHGWEVLRDDPAAWIAAVDPTTQVVLEHDPLPAQTRFTVAFPAFAGATLKQRSEGAPLEMSFGDEVLDAAFTVVNPTSELIAAVSSDRAPWLMVVRSWGARVTDGQLSLTFPGVRPRARWVRARGPLPPDTVLQQILTELLRLSRTRTGTPVPKQQARPPEE